MVLIGAKFLVFPQQRGFHWYEAKFVVSPSDAVLIDAAIYMGSDTGLSFIHALFMLRNAHFRPSV